MLNEIFKKIFEMMKPFQDIIIFYLGWIVLHYIASHLYCMICTPLTFFGFILSPFQSSSPLCIGLRWIINEAGNLIFKMWYIFGAWLAAKLLMYKPK